MSSPKRKLTSAPCSDISTGELESLGAIVRAYRRFNAANAQAELESFRREPSLEAAVERAAAAQDSRKKRYAHQRRLASKTLRQASLQLSAAKVQHCHDFDELHDAVAATIGDIRGVGELMVYDTALRIGAKMGLSPEVVYLHAGTRAGAKSLGFNHSKKTLTLSQLPMELRTLAAHEIEDLLCIFKDRLVRVTAG